MTVPSRRSIPTVTSCSSSATETRIYGLQERHEIVEGAHALTTYRVQKRIVGGHWERELIIENVQQVA